jgi:tetratricopeptide (TPR) repeat protein
MSLDQYSFCPCGNGKKIKFCKCNEHFQEMQVIHRMIVGEQNVAALDRINANLKTLPSEPWLLAMKSELLLQLNELDALEETTAKFIRLQPDNPLAKLYRSLVAVVRGNTEEAATLMLQAIADATEALPPMTATVALNLMEAMGQRGMILPAILHCEMLLDMGGDMVKVASGAYDSLTSQTNANTLSRESLPSPIEYDDAPYAERLAEANALVSAYRITSAKTKLESMQREFGLQAPILQSLLYCQLMLTDVESGGSTAGKIAAIASLPEPQRIYYQALAYELAPKTSGVAVFEELCQYTIEDSEFEQRLTANKNLLPIAVDQLKGMLEALLDEEVPPKLAFVCVEPVLQEQFAELEASRSGSWLAYYGKQTDKPARLISLEPPIGSRRMILERIKKELDIGSLNRVLLEKLPSSYLSQVTASIMLRKQVAPERRLALNDATRQLVLDGFLDYPQECLSGKTPREAAGDTSLKTKLAALLLHWQGSNTSSLTDDQFKQLHQQLNLQVPKLSSSQDVLDFVGGASYFWTDLSDIDPNSLIQLMQSALSRGVTSIFESLAQRSEQMQWPEEFKVSAEYTQLNLKTRVVTDPNDAEKLLKRIVELGKQLEVPIGNAVLERVEVLNMLGRNTESRQFLEQSLRENPNDPVLLQFMQMAMMRQQQAMRARGGEVASSQAASSGLWTPGQSAEPQQSAGSGSGGGSKLWIPGQD